MMKTVAVLILAALPCSRCLHFEDPSDEARTSEEASSDKPHHPHNSHHHHHHDGVKPPYQDPCPKLAGPANCERIEDQHCVWSGTACLNIGSTRCKDITVMKYCKKGQKAFDYLGCAGWGGERCMRANATARDITDEDICDLSMKLYNIPSGGWGGRTCLPPNPTCADIQGGTECKGAKDSRMKLDCAGWGGHGCLPPRFKTGSSEPQWGCKDVTAEILCSYARDLLGHECGEWDEKAGHCLEV